MTKDKGTKQEGKCYNCGSPLELCEIDLKKSTKVLVCRDCGLFHFYKKDFIGTYKLTKVSKNSQFSGETV
jgi:transcription elongation factor Elf1